jgi:hypothetical protein
MNDVASRTEHLKPKGIPMSVLIVSPLFAAAGWSLLYLLFGGGLLGAIILFIVLKAVGA